MKPHADCTSAVTVVLFTAGHVTAVIGKCFPIAFVYRHSTLRVISTAPYHLFIATIKLKPLCNTFVVMPVTSVLSMVLIQLAGMTIHF